MTATFTVSRHEREALHWLLCRRLFVLGQDPPELARKEGVTLNQLAVEFGEDLRLMSDIGWEPERGDDPIALTMPREDLLRTLKRLRRDARRGPSEERHPLEPGETDEERWTRFQPGVVTCEELLGRLAPAASAEAATPATIGVCPEIGGEELRPYGFVTNGFILAATERAECHEQADEVWATVLAEHLGFKSEPDTNALLFPRLEDLRRACLLTSIEKQGEPLWGLTDAGRERLAVIREVGEVGELPEAPQHRAWRQARVRAAVRVEGFRSELVRAVADADRLLTQYRPVMAGEWFDLSERLRQSSWRLASATYCLTEWPEPSDNLPDADENPGPSPGRRTTSAWDQCSTEN